MDTKKSFEEVRIRVVERLRPRQAEIEQALYTRARKDVPDPVGDKNPDYQAGLKATVSSILDYTFGVIERGLVAAPIPPAAASQARRAARAGVSLGTIQRRYFAGHAEFGHFVAQAVDELELSNSGRALDHLRRTQETLLGHITAAIEQEYVHERALIARPLECRRTDTVRKLLAGEPVGQAELDELDYQLHAYWHLGVIATGGTAKDVLSHLRTGLERRLLQAPCGDGAIAGWLGGQHELAICDLECLLSANGYADSCVVIGGPGRGLDGFRQTHREARDALVVALRKTERIVRYADSPLFAAAVQNDTLMRWLKDFLAPLRSYKDGGVGLLQVLRALIDSECNRRAAATALDIDRHTVESRLRTAEALLGRALPTCLPELDIALRLEELDGAMTVAESPRP